MAASISGVNSWPDLAILFFVTVAKTVAACSPPITEIRELGHMNKNLKFIIGVENLSSFILQSNIIT